MQGHALQVQQMILQVASIHATQKVTNTKLLFEKVSSNIQQVSCLHNSLYSCTSPLDKWPPSQPLILADQTTTASVMPRDPSFPPFPQPRPTCPIYWTTARTAAPLELTSNTHTRKAWPPHIPSLASAHTSAYPPPANRCSPTKTTTTS
jgi:hypothetical protein